ncbi:MAG: hypothetical protein DPW19_10665, partial [cyanobacterium CYA1]|nr:hypothetical protein [cyanobacterium CYA1]
VRVGNGQIEATTTKVTGTGDTPYKVDRRNHAPSVAVDRDQSPNHVYVAFCARSAQGSTNTDIYIHKSEDRGESFPNQPQYLLQLTDTLLGVEVGDTGVDQFVPAIAVDTCGGINVMFYDNRHDPDRTDGVELVDVSPDQHQLHRVRVGLHGRRRGGRRGPDGVHGRAGREGPLGGREPGLVGG